MRAYLKLFILLIPILAVGCAKVTIRPDGATAITSREPDYDESQSLFFFGLGGHPKIKVSTICGDRDVEQMQTRDTFGNMFLTVITLGIYTPRTATVWCSQTSSQAPQKNLWEEGVNENP